MQTNRMLATMLATFVTLGAYAQTADEIIDKHVAALGGADKLNGVKTVMFDRTLSVQGMDIPVVSTILVGKAMRSESSVMGTSMVQAVDGKTGWSIRPTMMGGTGEPEDMDAAMLKQSMGQVNPFGALVNYKTNGTKVELVGKEKVDGKDAYHLKLTTQEGQVVDEFVDASTYMVSKVTMMAGDQKNDIGFSDYKEVSGVKFPYTMEMNNQMGNLTFSTNKVVVNGPVDESIFKKPAK